MVFLRARGVQRVAADDLVHAFGHQRIAHRGHRVGQSVELGLQSGLGVVGAAVEVGQRQGQPLSKLFMKRRMREHIEDDFTPGPDELL